MHQDGFLVTYKRQPPKLLSWPRSAKLLLDGRGEFIRFEGPVVKGIWSVTCFPFKGITNRLPTALSSAEIRQIAVMVDQIKKYDHPLKYSRVDGMERLLRACCDYPPYSLEDDWDGKSNARWAWAALIHRTYPFLQV